MSSYILLLTWENAQPYTVIVKLGECSTICRCCYYQVEVWFSFFISSVQPLLMINFRPDIEDLLSLPRIQTKISSYYYISSLQPLLLLGTTSLDIIGYLQSKEALPMRFRIRKFSPYSQLFQPTIVENLDRKRQRNRITILQKSLEDTLRIVTYVANKDFQLLARLRRKRGSSLTKKHTTRYRNSARQL